jgi:uncharacterized protein
LRRGVPGAFFRVRRERQRDADAGFDNATDIMDLHNETAVNVAALLKEPVGSTRSYALDLDRFALDTDLLAEDVAGSVKLTRLSDEIIASIRARGSVTLECQRCLRTYPQPFRTDFDEEFREAYDVRTGAGVASGREDDERFSIDENHELDVAEPLRQEILVSLPMRPDCGDDCPGPDILEVGEADAVDDRFAALADLLDDDQPS